MSHPLSMLDAWELATGPLGSWDTIERLVDALEITGPLIVRGWILSSREGLLRADRNRALDEFGTYTGADGFPRTDRNRIPPDDELSKAWGLPLACDVPAPPGWFDRPRVVGSFGPNGAPRREVTRCVYTSEN